MGFAYERANGSCSLDGFLRPDACCSSPASRQRKGWWEMNLTGRVSGENSLRVADGWPS